MTPSVRLDSSTGAFLVNTAQSGDHFVVNCICFDNQFLFTAIFAETMLFIPKVTQPDW
jgi:hypothetical protein